MASSSLETERIEARTIFWAAGNAASSLGASLGAPLDRMGRVVVNDDLSITGRPEVFVIGDLAVLTHERQAGAGRRAGGDAERDARRRETSFTRFAAKDENVSHTETRAILRRSDGIRRWECLLDNT